MKDEILEVIAANSIFGIDEVSRAYDLFKSYDLLIAACELCRNTGHSNLEVACIFAKAKKDKDDDDGDVFHMEYIDASTVRLKRLPGYLGDVGGGFTGDPDTV